MRIAQIAPLMESVPPKLYGGTERIVSYLTEELVKLGHDVTLFASGDSVTSAKLVSCVPTALRLDPKVFDVIPYYMLMLDRVRRQSQQFDILHFHIDYLHFPLFRDMSSRVLTTLHGRQDLPLAPDEFAGFTMALLRMLAFAPGTRDAGEPQRSGSARGELPQAPAAAGDRQPAARGSFDGDWPKLANSLSLGGVAKQLAQASELGSFDGEALELYLPPAAKHLAERSFQEKLRGALQERFGKPVRLTVTIRETTGNSARDRAAAAVTRDAFVRDLVENFDATIVESSIKPAQ